MILIEFEPRRKATKSTISCFDDIPIKSGTKYLNGESTNNIRNLKEKRQRPFPYLKRKSVRVDLIIKEEKKQMAIIEKLKNEKKLIETENLILKGRIMQMELLIQEFNLFKKENTKIPCRSQCCQTSNSKVLRIPESIKKDNSIVQCNKCKKSLQSKYFTYHSRVCGNIQLSRILCEKDLKRLQYIRKNQKNQVYKKPKNDWRMKRQEFLNNIKNAQKKSPKNCIIFYRPKQNKN